jgi:hypothetical protein
MRTVVGVIDTPNTMSTDPSKVFATLSKLPLRIRSARADN